MHKSATKCNEILSKWCKNKHGAPKIMDTLETYHTTPGPQQLGPAGKAAGHLAAQPTGCVHGTSAQQRPWRLTTSTTIGQRRPQQPLGRPSGPPAPATPHKTPSHAEIVPPPGCHHKPSAHLPCRSKLRATRSATPRRDKKGNPYLSRVSGSDPRPANARRIWARRIWAAAH
jgi:hypothetical protein